jgi:hypothetical protein
MTTTATASPPTARYRTVVYDSARWNGFELRPGDVVISTPPKCGTTLTQLCCALLLHDGPELPAPLEQLSPWIDMTIRPVEDVHAVLVAQTHRRIIKTHTPLDGVPFHPEVTYVVVGRDPRDVAVSWDHHFANLDWDRFFELRATAVSPEDDGAFSPPPAPADDPAGRYAQFIAGAEEGGMHLGAVLEHLAVAWDRRGLPNVHLVHYSDLRRDLPSELVRLAAALGVPCTPERAAELAAEASLDRMRERAGDVVPSASVGLWRDPSRFIRTGGIGEWRDLTTPEIDDLYRRRIAENTTPDLAAWLHAGANP